MYTTYKPDPSTAFTDHLAISGHSDQEACCGPDGTAITEDGHSSKLYHVTNQRTFSYHGKSLRFQGLSVAPTRINFPVVKENYCLSFGKGKSRTQVVDISSVTSQTENHESLFCSKNRNYGKNREEI